jgi:hypothetical protein
VGRGRRCLIPTKTSLLCIQFREFGRTLSRDRVGSHVLAIKAVYDSSRLIRAVVILSSVILALLWLVWVFRGMGATVSRYVCGFGTRAVSICQRRVFGGGMWRAVTEFGRWQGARLSTGRGVVASWRVVCWLYCGLRCVLSTSGMCGIPCGSWGLGILLSSSQLGGHAMLTSYRGGLSSVGWLQRLGASILLHAMAVG